MPEPLSPDEQDAIIGQIGEILERDGGEGEVETLYDQLDAEHRSQVDDMIREYADNAVGDEHWDSDS
ncbi:hypothetical protein [Cellulomonas sp. ES6]|uniref:hypothetical protein n=1 Tax=Cellulomonas sp. ES6 TaxID=3039384 RepID=UPI0024B65E5F|nr:hypothetical protein [Cellulomonas sp. ES6]WHP16615.1 hypothetical protein P9841_13450 [Cellulomonas sp. ES6]